MDGSITDGAVNQKAEYLGVVETGQSGANMLVDDGGHARLDFFWPMPIGLLVMGSVVAVFFGICSMLR